MTALWDIPHLREMQASPVWGDHFIPGEVRVPYQLLQLEEFHNKVTLLFFLWAYFTLCNGNTGILKVPCSKFL